MSQAAAAISYALERHERFMDEWLERAAQRLSGGA